MGLRGLSAVLKALIVLLLVQTTPVWALTPVVDITPFVGYRLGGSFKNGDTGDSLTVDDASVYGLSLEMDYDEGQLQLLWSRQDTDLKAPISAALDQLNVNIDYYHFGGTYSWSDDVAYKPYVGFSLGVTNFQPTDTGFSNELRFSMGLGFGVKYFITKRIGVMVEGRGWGTIMGDSGAVFCSNSSCNIRVDGPFFMQLEGRTGLVIRF